MTLTSRWIPCPGGIWTGYLATRPQWNAVHWYWWDDRNITNCEVPHECHKICPVAEQWSNTRTDRQTIYHKHKVYWANMAFNSNNTGMKLLQHTWNLQNPLKFVHYKWNSGQDHQTIVEKLNALQSMWIMWYWHITWHTVWHIVSYIHCMTCPSHTWITSYSTYILKTR